MSEQTNMTAVAGYLAVGFVVLFALVWFKPWSTGEEATNVNKGPAVKVDAKLAASGEALSTSNGCTACHTIDGGSGAGPTWQGMYGSTGKRGGEIDEAYIADILADPPPTMANFKGKFDEEDSAAIAEYIKSLQ